MSREAWTSSMPSTMDLGARAYVGVPVVRTDGTLVGTLCGLHSEARDIPAAGVQFLAVLGRLLAFQVEREEHLVAQQASRRALEELNAELREQHEFEKQLIGVVSHDLRTPLSAILTGSSALALDPSLGDGAGRIVQRLLSSTRRAGRMVHSLLDFALARSRGIPVFPEPADLGAVVRGVVDEMTAADPRRQIRVVAEGSLAGELDRDRLAQVATNLLENALAHGTGDSATARISGTERELRLAIVSRGTPLPPDVVARIFQPFERTSGSGRGGVGLGLFIVRSIVEAHGGAVAVSSADGENTFEVRLPKAPRRPEAPDGSPEHRPADLPASSV